MTEYYYYYYYCERFEPRSHFKRLSLIVWVNVVLNRTVVVDNDCIIVVIVVVVVVVVDDETYCWVFLFSDHQFQVYYEVRQVLLQSATAYFITRCDGLLLQSATERTCPVFILTKCSFPKSTAQQVLKISRLMTTTYLLSILASLLHKAMQTINYNV